MSAQRMDLVEERVEIREENKPRSWEVKPTVGLGGIGLGSLGKIVGGGIGLQATIRSPESTTITNTTRIFRPRQDTQDGFNNDNPKDNKKFNENKLETDQDTLRNAQALSLQLYEDEQLRKAKENSKGFVLGGNKDSNNQFLSRLEADQDTLRNAQALSLQLYEDEQLRKAMELSEYNK